MQIFKAVLSIILSSTTYGSSCNNLGLKYYVNFRVLIFAPQDKVNAIHTPKLVFTQQSHQVSYMEAPDKENNISKLYIHLH